MRSDRNVATVATLLALLASSFPNATAKAASESFARCNRTRAMAAVGLPVRGSELTACTTISPPVFGGDDDKLRQSIGLVGQSMVFPPVDPTRPQWMSGAGGGVTPGLLYGVGSGATVQDAFREATLLLAGQLSTSIYSQRETVSSSSNAFAAASGMGSASASATTSVRTDATRIIVSGTLQDVRVTGVFQDPATRQFTVQVSLDPRAAERRADAAGEAGFEILAAATERFAVSVQEAGLGEEAVRLLLDAQNDLALLGRSPFGRAGASRWRVEEREFRRLVEYVQGCAELRFGAFHSPDPAMAPIPASANEYPPIIAQNLLVGRLFCGDKPLRGVRFRVSAEGGMSSFPDTLRTATDGGIQLNVEAVRGTGQVRLVLRPQYTDSEYRQGGAVIGMTSTRSADYRIEVRGIPSAEAGGLLEAVRALAVRRWNAREVATGAPPVRCVIQVDVPNATAVMGRVSQPVSLSVSFNAEQGSIFDRRQQSAFLGNSPEEARRGAMATLASMVQSW